MTLTPASPLTGSSLTAQHPEKPFSAPPVEEKTHRAGLGALADVSKTLGSETEGFINPSPRLTAGGRSASVGQVIKQKGKKGGGADPSRVRQKTSPEPSSWLGFDLFGGTAKRAPNPSPAARGDGDVAEGVGRGRSSSPIHAAPGGDGVAGGAGRGRSSSPSHAAPGGDGEAEGAVGSRSSTPRPAAPGGDGEAEGASRGRSSTPRPAAPGGDGEAEGAGRGHFPTRNSELLTAPGGMKTVVELSPAKRGWWFFSSRSSHAPSSSAQTRPSVESKELKTRWFWPFSGSSHAKPSPVSQASSAVLQGAVKNAAVEEDRIDLDASLHHLALFPADDRTLPSVGAGAGAAPGERETTPPRAVSAQNAGFFRRNWKAITASGVVATSITGLFLAARGKQELPSSRRRSSFFSS